ncbi:MAG: transglutaminase-like domain-containing protein [Isosphaeraceae bacterium]
MGKPFDRDPEFQRLLRGDDHVDLSRLAMELARDAYPDLDADRYLRRIDDLAGRVRDRCADGLKAKPILGQINWVLFHEENYRGNQDDYYDPRNSYLSDVIDRRVGIPISLSVLYLAVAERIGLAMAGVNLPAHFVVRLREAPLFVDPFHQGILLDREGCARRVAEVTGQEIRTLPETILAPCPPRVMISRMLRNLKATYLQREEYMDALPVLRRLIALAPDDPEEHRDLGIVCMHTDRPGEAVAHLQSYLDARPEADDRETVALIHKAAWRDLARRN